MKSKNSSEGISIALDSKGNSYVTGNFGGTVTFGKTKLNSAGKYDIFIAKYDPDGNCLWAKQAGGSGLDFGKGIAVDPTGDLYVAGTFRDTASFGTIKLIGYGNDDIFIAKYDNGGNCLWAEKAGGINQDDCLGISIDKNGNSYITGYFQDTASFGPVKVTGTAKREIFIAKYDPRGKCVWLKETGGGDQSIGQSISVDVSGYIYVTGNFEGFVKFGAFQLNGNGMTDIFIAKFDPSGNCIWVEQGGAKNQDVGYSIAVDKSGSSYVTGLFQGPAHIAEHQLNGFGKEDVFIAKLDSNGKIIWAKDAGGRSVEYGRGIAIDSKGNSYITGNFQRTVEFDTFHLSASAGIQIFTAMYDQSGKCLWVNQAGNNYYNWGNSIAVDSKGNSYVTGLFQGVASFGTIKLSGADKFNSFIAKYDPSGKCLWVKQSTIEVNK